MITTRDRYQLPTRVVQCVTCALRFINPRMTAEGYTAFYRHGYRPLLNTLVPIPQRVANLELDQMAYATDLRAQIARWIPVTGTLLDVGGSTGVVGRAFLPAYRVTVVDPSAEELARAEGCTTICGAAETVDFPQVDVALLCRTIDHLLDPLGVLRRLRQAAAWLVVDAMDVDRWPETWRYKVDHPYAFTAATLDRLVTAAGWRIRDRWTRRGGYYVGLVCSPQE